MCREYSQNIHSGLPVPVHHNIGEFLNYGTPEFHVNPRVDFGKFRYNAEHS